MLHPQCFDRSNGPPPPHSPETTCFEKDSNVPVDKEVIFEGHCEDVHGNKYKENLTTSSCCECLMYVF